MVPGRINLNGFFCFQTVVKNIDAGRTADKIIQPGTQINICPDSVCKKDIIIIGSCFHPAGVRFPSAGIEESWPTRFPRWLGKRSAMIHQCRTETTHSVTCGSNPAAANACAPPILIPCTINTFPFHSGLLLI